MSEELEQSSGIDVSQESSPAPESNSSEPAKESASSAPSLAETKPDSTPFHEHPRFKELIQQKNESVKRFEDAERRFKDLESRLESYNKSSAEAAKPKDGFVDALSKVNPDWAKSYENVLNSQKELGELREWRKQMETQNYLNSARGTVDKLQSELKVDSNLHQLYLASIPMGTPLEKISDLYKGQHDRISKLFSDKEREAISKYSTEKKADSKLPTSSKSSAPKAPSEKKFSFSKDRDEARAQMVKQFLSTKRESAE